MVGVESLVEDPAPHQPPENPVKIVGQRHKHDKHDQMHCALGVLAIEHRTDARDQAEDTGEEGIRLPAARRQGTSPRRTGISGGRHRPPSRSAVLQTGAGLTEDPIADPAKRNGGQRTATFLAEAGGSWGVWAAARRCLRRGFLAFFLVDHCPLRSGLSKPGWLVHPSVRSLRTAWWPEVVSSGPSIWARISLTRDSTR